LEKKFIGFITNLEIMQFIRGFKMRKYPLGICRICGNNIDKDHLVRHPFANFCKRCKDARPKKDRPRGYHCKVVHKGPDAARWSGGDYKWKMYHGDFTARVIEEARELKKDENGEIHCFICGRPESDYILETGHKFDSHHLDWNKENNDLLNFDFACHSEHRELHHKHDKELGKMPCCHFRKYPNSTAIEYLTDLFKVGKTFDNSEIIRFFEMLGFKRNTVWNTMHTLRKNGTIEIIEYVGKSKRYGRKYSYVGQ